MNPHCGMHRTDWDDGDDRAREFNLAISDWCALFDRVGFDVVGFHELRARAPSPQRRFFATAEWAPQLQYTGLVPL